MTLPAWALGLMVIFVALAVVFGVWLFARRRPTAEELERRRRLAIHQTGKMGDGEIIDVDGVTIVYSYSVAGVVYTASQDTTELRDKLPADWTSMVGPVSVKFAPRNPANSIVLCEEWSGLRNRESGSRV